MGGTARSKFEPATTTVARYVGISGLDSIPVNPWCQRPGRPPRQNEWNSDKESTLSGKYLALDIAMLLLGIAGLFSGLGRLSVSPLSAVLIIVGAMFFLLFPVAEFCRAELRPPARRRK